MPERPNGAVLKTADRRKAVRGFKSHPRRYRVTRLLILDSLLVGRSAFDFTQFLYYVEVTVSRTASTVNEQALTLRIF